MPESYLCFIIDSSAWCQENIIFIVCAFFWFRMHMYIIWLPSWFPNLYINDLYLMLEYLERISWMLEYVEIV